VLACHDGDPLLLVRHPDSRRRPTSELFALEAGAWSLRSVFADVHSVATRGGRWLALGADGLFESDDDGFTWAPASLPPSSSGAATVSLHDVAFDRDGAAWLCTSAGVCRRTKGAWRPLPEARLPAPTALERVEEIVRAIVGDG
jgi:hypothetical protein